MFRSSVAKPVETIFSVFLGQHKRNLLTQVTFREELTPHLCYNFTDIVIAMADMIKDP